MIKTVKIGSKEYNMKASAFTMFAYKNETGRGLIQDVNELYKKFQNMAELEKEEQTYLLISEMDDLAQKTLKLAHIMITEYDKSFMSYENFLKEVDSLFDDVTWILEVLELGMTPFQGRISNSTN